MAGTDFWVKFNSVLRDLYANCGSLVTCCDIFGLAKENALVSLVFVENNMRLVAVKLNLIGSLMNSQE